MRSNDRFENTEFRIKPTVLSILQKNLLMFSAKLSFGVSLITFDQLCKYRDIHTHRFLRNYEVRLRLLDARRKSYSVLYNLSCEIYLT